MRLLYLLGPSICKHVGLFVSWTDSPTCPRRRKHNGLEITYN
jgi:hypothetical protein